MRPSPFLAPKKALLLTFALIFSAAGLLGQTFTFGERFAIGAFGSASVSHLGGWRPTLIPDGYDPTSFQTREDNVWNLFNAGLFAQCQLGKGSEFAVLQPFVKLGFSYSQQGGDFKYWEGSKFLDDNSLSYHIRTRYNYFNISPSLALHVGKPEGLFSGHVGLGLQFSIKSGTDKLNYTSKNGVGKDPFIEEILKENLHGRSATFLCPGGGIDFYLEKPGVGISIDYHYQVHIGNRHLLAVEPTNGYYFSERQNLLRAHVVTFSILKSLDLD